MSNYPKYTLTGQTPAQTYEALVQFNHESSSLVDGNGNDITASLIQCISSSYSLSSSNSLLSITSSYAPTITVGLTTTKSFIGGQVTQSIYILNGLIINWTP